MIVRLKLLLSWVKGLFIRSWVLFSSQFAHIILFLTVNVILGALGFIVPIAIEYVATDDFLPALKKQLDAAGAYTFAIAFLASCVSLVAAEYLDRKEVAEYRNQKILLSVMAGLIVIFCSVFSGSQTARSLIEDSAKSHAETVSRDQVVLGTPTTASGVTERGRQAQKAAKAEVSLSRLDRWQINITGLAVLVGLILFLVFKYQEPSMKEQLAIFLKQTEHDVDDLMTGLQVGRR